MPTDSINVQEITQRYYKYLLSYKKLILLVGILSLLLVLFYGFFISKPKYESVVSILPSQDNAQSFLGQLGGVASLAGISLSPGGGGFSPELYQKTITSESVLAGVVNRYYNLDSIQVNLFEIFNIKSDKEDSSLRQREMNEKLIDFLNEKVISSELERLTKVLTITVSTNYSSLSKDICYQLIESLDRYMKEQRKTSANNQVIYLDKRIAEIKSELTTAENTIVDFLERNRNYQQSPALLTDYGRLLRHKEIQQTIFIELTKQLELSKLEVVKDTQIINILEEPSFPARSTGMHVVLKSIIIYFVLNLFFLFALLVFISIRDKYHFTVD